MAGAMIYSGLTIDPPTLAYGPGFRIESGPRFIVAELSRRIRMADIALCVADYFDISLRELKGPSRRRGFARPRQIAIYLCHKFTNRTMPDLGRFFGDRDHTTVIHAIRRIAELIEAHGEVADDVDRLTWAIRSGL